MVINSYFFVHGDTRLEDKSHIISTVDRDAYMTNEYAKLSKQYFESLNLKGSTALLVAAGPASHHSESRVFNGNYKNGSVAIKSQASYGMFNIAKLFRNVELDYANINANTCASSMHCIYEAYDLIHNKGFSHVIVIAMEQVEESELLLFRQLNIDLVCGDGFCFMVLSKECENPLAEINSTSFIWNREHHPMFVSKEGYLKLISKLDNNVDLIKPHGTGTGVNDDAENSAIQEVFGDIQKIYYKDKIGHTQGASAVLELAMLCDEIKKGTTAMCLASGLGGFYGGCTIRKF